ncbi:MAG: hypothetical protein ACE144_20360 [Thermodesulfobacteriota bacterium]
MAKILVVSNIPWHALKQRPQFLAELLSKRYEVVFFESPGSFPRRLIMRKAIRPLNDRILLIQNNKLMPFRPIFKGLHFVEVNRALNERFLTSFLGPGEEVVVIAENYLYLNYLKLRDRFNIRKIIYDCVDLIEYFDPANRTFRLSYEEQLAEAADHIVVVSRELERKFNGYGKKVVRISNGVDFDQFQKAMDLDLVEICERVRKGFPNVLGYIGSIDERFDFEVIERVLGRNVDSRAVLIGLLGKEASKRYHHLHQKFGDRIETLGVVDHDRLAPYIKYFDFGIMPYNLQYPAVKGINPVKLNQYFAMGKSVIANVWEELSGLHDNRKLIDFNTYIENRTVVEKNLNGKGYEEKIAIARANDWENKVQGFINLIEN